MASRPAKVRSKAAPEGATFDQAPRRRLAFRFGFCAIESGALGEARASALRARGWSERRIGWLDLWAHPDATVQTFDSPRGQFCFVGDVFMRADGDLGGRIAALPGDDDPLFGFLNDLSGRFALLIVEQGRARVFNDPIGSRSVFYNDGAPFAVSSHAFVLAAALGAAKCPDVAAYRKRPEFRFRKTNALPGDRTVYRDIHALTPNNLFDSEGMTTRRYWPRRARRSSAPDQFFAAMDESLAALARHVRPRFVPVFGSTGGVDTRAAIAGFRSLSVPFETVTWLRDALSPRESGIVDRLNAALGAPHTDLKSLGDPGDLRRLTVAASGGLRSHWKIAAAVHAAFGDRPDAVFLRAWGAEVMRGFYNLWPTEMRDLTPEEMARAYYDPFNRREPPAGTVAFFEAYHRRGNYAGIEAFGYDPNDLFYWEHRMGMWGAMCHNEMDVAIRSLVCFNDRHLYATALGLEPKSRLTKQLLLAYVGRLDPPLAAIPLDRERSAAVARRRRTDAASAYPGGLGAGAVRIGRGLVGRLRQIVRRLRSAAPEVLKRLQRDKG